ncbi:MAG TPA: PAS domain S-box protein [Oligoflexus sp.]|uniref:PAS domain S-box protein n=1 Tax=Oligoflexus sp. TaxID=1971216 RepID=UPI002D33DB93|nr:PAS domain S-box protein [Oligoflexus sp.]HYX36001.1 PAS domain S-box protein [Oligoflexus sp.]
MWSTKQVSSPEKVNILLVDDTPSNLTALEAILSRTDYCLVKAHSASEALRLLLLESYAVILLDVMMPEMDGYEFAIEAKSFDHSRDTPIIFVTAIASEPQYIAKGYAHGAADYLTKPLDPDEVRAKINVFVDLHRKNLKLQDAERRLTLLNAELTQRAETRARELTASNERFRIFVEGVQEYGFIQMDEKGRFITWNAGAERILGYTQEEIIGLPFDRIFTTEDVLSGVPEQELSIARARGRADDTRWHLRKDGSRFWAHGITTLLLDENGHQCGFAKVLRDYTESKKADDALRESESMLHLVTSAVPALVCYVGPDQRYRFANDTYRDWFGYQPDLMRGKHVSEVFGPDAYGELKSHIETAFATEREVSFEVSVLLPNERELCVAGSYTPHTDEAGIMRGVVGLMTDISARKSMENALKESEQRLNLVIDCARNYGIFALDTSGRVSSWNQGAESLSGYQAEEIVGQHFSAFFPSEDVAAGKCEDELKVASDMGRCHDEGWRLKKDGTRYWSNVTLSAMRDHSGKLLGFVKVIRDDTERKVADDRLRASEQRSRHLAERLLLTQEAAQIASWEFNLADRTAFWNGAVSAVFGQCPENFDDFLQHVEPSDRKHLRRYMSKAESSGAELEVEYRFRLSDGSMRWIQSKGRIYRNAIGKAWQAIGIAINITDRKRAEEALRQSQKEAAEAKEAAEVASRLKSQFLANMSHEIRTPLGTILGFSECLRQSDLNEIERHEFIETIVRNAKALGDLIDDILDLSKVEAGKIKIEFLPVSLPSLLADIASSLMAKAREKHVVLDVAAPSGIPTIIRTDPARIRQILLNIVGNGIKFTEQGVVSVRMILQKQTADTAKQHLAFIVKDTGRGMSSEEQSRIFKPFGQADDSTTRCYGGTGLGLVLSRNLARALGGDVYLAESERGKGSTFIITIDPGEMEGWHESQHVATLDLNMERLDKPLPQLKGVRVLLAEDSEDNQILIKHILSKAGVDLDIVNNGADAVEMAEQRQYDVVLMDIQMPVLDGNDATEELRRRGYKRPVIALTAHAMLEEREKSLRAGANDHLTKPINSKKLIYTIIRYAGLQPGVH